MLVYMRVAKGLGRIVSRLPKSFGDEVVGAVNDIFVEGADDENAWHGERECFLGHNYGQ